MWGDPLSILQKNHNTGDNKICGEYTVKATIQNKMRLDKCDAYTAKETLVYRERKSTQQQKDRKTRKKQEKQIHKQITKSPQ